MSEDPAIKHDSGKSRIDLLPPLPLVDIGKVAAYGAQKYAPRNWEKGMPWGRMYAAAQRHLLAFWSGEDNDSESGLSHLAHAGFNILALLEYTKKHTGFDDRHE